MSIPVIFIHNGDSGYLPYSILQAKTQNENVILLGDDANAHMTKCGCKHELISNYDNTSKEFVKVYEPLSTLGQFETFCFERWFILYEYLKKNNIDKCFYLDSDVMLYTNVQDEWDKKFNQFDVTLTHRCVGSNSFFTYKGLNDICKMMYNIYKERGYEYDKIASHYHVMQKHGRNGGVCDMTLLEYYGRYKNPAGTGEMMYIIDDSVYDHCVSQADQNYEMENGMKKIQIKDNLPYCLQTTTNKMIKFNTLHFQGGHKTLLKNYYLK